MLIGCGISWLFYNNSITPNDVPVNIAYDIMAATFKVVLVIIEDNWARSIK